MYTGTSTGCGIIRLIIDSIRLYKRIRFDVPPLKLLCVHVRMRTMTTSTFTGGNNQN